MKKSKLFIFIFLIFIFISIPLNIKATAQIKEIHFGIEGDTLIYGGQYIITDNWNIMLEHVDGNPLGYGIYYHNDQWNSNFLNKAHLWQLSFANNSVGSMTYRQEKDTGNKSGNIAFNKTNLNISAGLSKNSDEDQGHLRANYNWSGGDSSFYWQGQDDNNQYSQEIDLTHQKKIQNHYLKGVYSTRLLENNHTPSPSNLALFDRFILNNHSFQLCYQSNQLEDSRFVGQGGELIWIPPLDWLKFGLGSYNETDNKSGQRYYLGATPEFDYRLNNTTLGIGGGNTIFFYSQGQRRHQLSAKAHIKQNWKQGQGLIELRRVEYIGKSPFNFDQSSKRVNLEAYSKITQDIGKAHSSLTANYNISDQEWQQLQGSLKIILFDKITTRFIGDFQIDQNPDPDDTIYIVEVKKDGKMAFKNRILYNYLFQPMELQTDIQLTFLENILNAKIDYDTKEKSLENIGLILDSENIGKISLDYNPTGPQILISYQPLQW